MCGVIVARKQIVMDSIRQSEFHLATARSRLSQLFRSCWQSLAK